MEPILLGARLGDLKYFDDTVDLQDHQPFKIHTIKLFYSNQNILGIQVYYYSFKSQQIIKCKDHKASKLFGVSEARITLLEDEYVNKVTCFGQLNRIEFKTNRQDLAIGIQEGDKVEVYIQDHQQLGAIAGGITKQLAFIEWSLQEKNQINKQYSQQLYASFIKEFPPQENAYHKLQRTYIVCEPKLIEVSVLNKYVQYKIVNEIGEIIYRRLKDLQQLRELLAYRWPGVYLPPLVGRSLVDDFSSEFIESARKSMEYFLIKAARMPYIFASIEFGIFINKTTKENEMEFVLQQLKEMTQPSTYEQLKLRYKQAFEEFAETAPVNEVQRVKVQQFSQFIQKLDNTKVADFTELKKLFESNSKNLNQMSRYVLTDLTELYSQQEIRQRSNSLEKTVVLQGFSEISEFFQNLHQEAGALWQALNYIRQLEQAKTKAEAQVQQNTDNAELKQNLESISSIWSILVKSYASYYIDEFHKQENLQYVFVLNRVAVAQLNNLKLKSTFWS